MPHRRDQIQLDQLLEFKGKWLQQQADLKNQLKHAQDALAESQKKIDDELGPLQEVLLSHSCEHIIISH